MGAGGNGGTAGLFNSRTMGKHTRRELGYKPTALLKHNPKVAVRIVGGNTAPAGAYPWMTALVTRGRTVADGQFCGGALIHSQWILTAAHCMPGQTPSSLDVVVGVNDLRTATPAQRLAVSQIIVHPQYYEASHGEPMNDVALLKLAQPLNGVPTLPLVNDPDLIALGNRARALGWGTTSEGGLQSPILLQVDLGISSLDPARIYFPNLSSVIHLGAGVPGGGKDACQGDSGGPLIVSDITGGWFHAGVVSFGVGCARPGLPGLYANTFAFHDWIIKETGIQAGDDHGNTAEKATTLVLDDVAGGRIGSPGDVDVFRLILTEGGTLMLGSRGSTDVVATLSNTAGTVLAEEVSPAGGEGHELAVHVPAGIYTLAIRGTGPGGGDYGLLARFAPAISHTAD